jgi:hypothetical protein
MAPRREHGAHVRVEVHRRIAPTIASALAGVSSRRSMLVIPGPRVVLCCESSQFRSSPAGCWTAIVWTMMFVAHLLSANARPSSRTMNPPMSAYRDRRSGTVGA